MMGAGYMPQPMGHVGLIPPAPLPYPPYGAGFGGAFGGSGCGGAPYGPGFGGSWGQPGLPPPPNLQMPQLGPPGGLQLAAPPPLQMPQLGVPIEMQQELAAKDHELRQLILQAGSLQQTLQAERAQKAAADSAAPTTSSALALPAEAVAELKRMQENLSSTAAEGEALAADIANAAEISQQLNAWFETNASKMRSEDERGGPSQYLEASIAGLKQQMDGLMGRWQQIQTVFGDSTPQAAVGSIASAVNSAGAQGAQPAVTVVATPAAPAATRPVGTGSWTAAPPACGSSWQGAQSSTAPVVLASPPTVAGPVTTVGSAASATAPVVLAAPPAARAETQAVVVGAYTRPSVPAPARLEAVRRQPSQGDQSYVAGALPANRVKTAAATPAGASPAKILNQS